MAQIKVLDLSNSNSLSELSYEDAQKVNGGIAGGIDGWKKSKRRPIRIRLGSTIFGAGKGIYDAFKDPSSPNDYEPESIAATALAGASLSS